ncbi:MAG: hypothetical protein JEZ05_05465 [Tenericutes bacterium]|nr:hypothetical protein [Mycoplasmatota bacterium]
MSIIRRRTRKNKIKHIIVLFLVFVFSLTTSIFFLEANPVINAQGQIDTVDILKFDGVFDWEETLDVQTSSTDYMTYSVFRDTYCKWDDNTYSPSACASAANGKKIRFDTAEELFRFSKDVSFDEIYLTGTPSENYKLSDAKIAVLLSLNYVLGNNIDYSVMASKAFIPIGYAFSDIALNVYERSFTGTFDGQGFVISNLYLAGYDYLVYVDTSEPTTPIDIAMSEHYSMFNYNEGSIRNLGLVNPNLEILELNTDITKLSNLVGFNMTNIYTQSDISFTSSTKTIASTLIDLSMFEAGDLVQIDGSTSNDGIYTVTGTPTANSITVLESLTDESAGTSIDLAKPGVVENVYVQDTRTSVTSAGMRYSVGTASEDFQAAGILHTNQGIFRSAYYMSKVVMNGYYINKFSVQPVIYTNNGTVSNLVYDSEVYLLYVTVNSQTFTIDTPNGIATGETTATLKSHSSSLNALTHEENGQTKHIWYFYNTDGYPLLNGFEYDAVNEVYWIDDEIDFAFFAKVIQFLTVNYDTNGLKYSASKFLLKNNIDMLVLAPEAYEIPSSTFAGELSGLNPAAGDLSENHYIYNLTISDGIVKGEEIYAGLFSTLGAGSVVSDLNFSQSTVSFNDTEDHYSKDFFIGALAGKMTGGTIENVLIDVDVSLGTQALGKTYAGTVVGKASGHIKNLSNYGSLSGNNHVYISPYNIEPTFYMGGIVGAAETSQLILEEVINNGDINGLQTASVFTLEPGSTEASIFIGGIIGYLNNTLGSEHQLIDVANKADIYIKSFLSSVSLPSYQYVGGVFGRLDGVAPILEEDSSYQFANLYNSGIIYHTYSSTGADITSAGIGVNNASEAIEYALLFNHAAYDFTEGAADHTQTQFKYAALIYDISSSDVTISRAYNYADFSFDKNIYDEIGLLYSSKNDNTTLLRFVANYGDINYMNNSGITQITLASDLNIGGITLESSVNYANVYNYGEINVVNLNIGTYSLHVAGFATDLATDHYIKRSLSDSDITVAEITGSGNIYIGGIVNINYAGDLQDAGQSTTQPVATEGIIDTMNSGTISTSYGVVGDGLYGILSTSNTFIGGVATLNKGSIQDAGNLGDISAANLNSSSAFTYETDSSYAGLVKTYNSGIVAGGISAMVIGGTSRIYDSANNGNVLVTAYKYVRAGGILGVSLYRESSVGGITSGMGLSNDIQNSILSNGVNLGNISAISNTIGSYSTSSTTTGSYYMSISENSPYISSLTIPKVTTTVGSGQRPEIYSSAGGVIGYGLSYMQRMLNHGTISATDVAGGVVGATYVLGDSTTTVNITTAINYGTIAAIDNSDVAAGIDKFEMSYSNISSNYMSESEFNDFVFPSGYSREYPEGKRGFGGIFGRLQRGTNGVMTNSGGAFDFIVNANEDVDLIGRLDQVSNFSISGRYFRFSGAIYYSAKYDDTTQNVFTGFRMGYYNSGTVTSYNTVTDIVYADYNGYIMYQVGITNNYLYESPTVYEGYYYDTTPASVGSTGNAGYIGGIPVPWITEDPNDVRITDSDTEYMYDPDFAMRTDSDLTEYIYFMTNDLLATRFTSTRPNGMYVLSTTAGQSFGLVLPRNIDIDYMRPIDEDYSGFISLLMDYDVVSPLIKENFSTEIETGFDNLKQTNFNDKAEVVASETTNVILTESGGSSNVLNNPDVDYVNMELTYTISIEAFNPAQTTASFAVTSALTSSGSLIARRAYDQYSGVPTNSQLEAYRLLLYPERALGISTSYAADLDITLPSQSITSNTSPQSVGFFSVYSEAFLGDDLYAKTAYYNDYEVFIIFTPGSAYLTGTTEIEDVAFNGGSQVTVTDPTDLRLLGNVNSLGSITLYFEDNKGILAQDYDFKSNFVIYYSGTVLSSSYYTVSSNPVDISGGIGYYNITFTFTNTSKAGDYYFEYSYFPTSTTFTTYFDKAASTGSSITSFNYYSNQSSVSIVSSTITSYVNVGYPLEDYMDTSTTNFTETINGSLPNYQSNYTYNIDFMTSGTLVISEFASVISAKLVSVSITNGYKTYQMEYIVEAENGSQTIYTHNLIERSVDLVSVLKNGNNVLLSNIHTSREAESTEFTVDLGFDQTLNLTENLYEIDPGAYSYLDIDVTGTTNDGLTTYTPVEIIGMTYDATDYLYIYFSYETLPGIYTFSFTYYRDGSLTDFITFASDLVIVKDLGTDAYLSDLKFSDIATETTYPDIYVANSDGTHKSSAYNPLIYFGGIDYDEADEFGESYFHVDGKVNNVPLDYYLPYMLDYLPYGATISRHAYDWNTSSWYWTDEADSNSTGTEIDQLYTNFTLYPDTGTEPNEGDFVKIEYRVTAEDGLTNVYYFVSVTDITFNLTVIFDIYYCTGADEGTCSLAKDSVDFNNELVIITVKNLDTNGDADTLSSDDPDDFPSFTTVNALNNRMTQFFYTSLADYEYKFGRNMSGFYAFDVELQLDQYLNDLYTYEIKFGEFYLADFDVGLGLNGKYYYIGPSVTMRTRRFNVYIREVAIPETDAPFGLFDFFKSWFYE